MACNEKEQGIITEESPIESKNIQKIIIPENYNNLLQIDSIFEKITAIPLETNKNCLLTSVFKLTVRDSFVFIQNRMDNLYVFSLNSGKFIKEIGKKGKGPGEFIELRDFDIGETGDIYILDYKKILKYTKNGVYVKKYMFEFTPDSKIRCNPTQFGLSNIENFHIWGGSIGIKNNDDNNLFLMYKINDKAEVVARYFPVNHTYTTHYNQFSRFSNHYNLQPWFGSNNIYSVDDNGVSLKYSIDFGKLTMNENIPKNFKISTKYKKEIKGKYANSIRNFIETKDWIHFRFNYKKSVYVYYSKRTKNIFTYMPEKKESQIIKTYMQNYSSSDNTLISLIEPRIIIENIEKMDSLSDIEKNFKKSLKKTLNKTSENDNHILIRCKMKKY